MRFLFLSVFDPEMFNIYVKEFINMKVFTTEKIEKLLKDEYMGYGISRSNLFVHQRIGGTRKAGIKFLMTHEEMIEWSRCYNDVNYFAEKYCKIRQEDGQIGNMELRDYLDRLVHH